MAKITLSGRVRLVTIVACKIRLHLPSSHSLKAKRQVLKSIIGQTRARFDLAVAEVDSQDLWQIGDIGLACVTSDARHGQEVISKAVAFVAGARLGEADLIDYQTEVAEVL